MLISLRVENVINSQPNNDRGMQTVLKSFHIVNGLVHSGLSQTDRFNFDEACEAHEKFNCITYQRYS